jgi:hypothetical protein
VIATNRKREPPIGLISAATQLTLFAEGNAEDRAGLVPNSPPNGGTANLPPKIPLRVAAALCWKRDESPRAAPTATLDAIVCFLSLTSE